MAAATVRRVAVSGRDLLLGWPGPEFEGAGAMSGTIRSLQTLT